MSLLIIVIYFLVLTFIFFYAFVEFTLAISYIKSKRSNSQITTIINKDKDYPIVTIQLPVYNEIYVIERLIDSVVKIKWPKEKLEIQVLDDSTDETTSIIADKVTFYNMKGYDIQHIRRNNREGYKAGALQHGISLCKGEFIAIFDADFLPTPLFLEKTIHHFLDKSLGMVQTKWNHLNPKYSLLTRLQEFALNVHFSIEQRGRNDAGCFINFNGTAGIWRKSCIVDAGGWQSDTLTEDLDLSYRAQLKGWKFIYREDVASPAELPVTMEALRTQQFRWSKGAAECARKNLFPVLTNRSLPFYLKINAFFHLMNSSMFICMMILILLSLPLIFISNANPYLGNIIQLSNYLFISTILLGFSYFLANKRGVKYSLLGFIKNLIFFPIFLCIYMGIAMHISVGVIEGFIGIKSPFIRTPKFNISENNQLNKNRYIKGVLSPLLLMELFILFYAVLGIYYSFQFSIYYMILFLLMIVLGYSYTSFYTLKNAFIKKV